MNDAVVPLHRRILVVDDNRAIHDDFQKIFAAPDAASGLSSAEAALFGQRQPDTTLSPAPFQIDSAFQGSEALELVRRALAEQRPYAVAFMDVRMPPGWDGIETTSRIWQVDPQLQVVICTAYSDYSWDEMLARLGQSDRLVILKKPFDTIEVLQLANALAEKWRLGREARRTLLELEDRIEERTSALRTSESLLAEAEAVAMLGSWAWDIREDRVTWSLELLRIFGLSAERSPGRFEDCMRLVEASDRERLRQAMEAAVARREPFEQEIRILRGGTDPRVLHCRGVAQADSEGVVIRLVGVCQDVTVRRQAEHELSRSHRALRMLSACNEALIRVQQEGELLQRVCRVAVEFGGYGMAWAGYAREDDGRHIEVMAHAGTTDADAPPTTLTWNDGAVGGRAPAARAIGGSEVIVVEDLARGEDPVNESLGGRYRGAVSLPLLDDERTFGALTLYTAEAAAISGEEIELLQELADNVAFGISGIRARIESRRSEEAVLKIARGVSEANSGDFFDLLTTTLVEVLDAHGGLVGRVVASGSAILTSSLLVDGRRHNNTTYPLAGSPSEDVLAQGYYVVERDASLLHPASRMLRDYGVSGYAGIRLRSSGGSNLGVLAVMFHDRVSRPGRILSILRIFAGRAAAELERQETDARMREQASLLDKAHDAIIVRGIDDRIRYWNKGAEAVFGWTAAEAVGRSMEELLCEEPGSLNQALTGVMERGEWSGNIPRQRRKDGRLATLAAHWSLVRNEAGRPQAILAINTDITERLAIDERLQQSQRLEAVGQLTGGVAHDFNNLLTVIQGNSELLVEELETQPALRELAEMIGNAARRGADLTHRLLAFARRQALEPRVVDARQLLAGMEGLLRRTLREDIELRVMHEDGLWPALVDPSQLEGAVLNLCINARDAMERGGCLTIETVNAWRDPDYPGQLADMQPGRYVMVAVSDTGKGIPAENLKRVFEPFFTTKEFGKGTGLGLSMVYGFVRQSQGHVTIYSEVGQGTTVRMYLPAADGAADIRDEGPVELSNYRGNEKILLTEDDDLVRRFAQDQLESLGYRVVSARSGSEALELLRSTPDVDLLLTDVVMPGGISGPELAGAALALRPGLRVLFSSGYTEGAMLHAGKVDGSVHLLNKPYRRIDLARKVRAALAQAQSL